ncbi:MAG: LPS export ABC transporter periplasmic protein LptC [Hyphomicrobiaceae bacterium]
MSATAGGRPAHSPRSGGRSAPSAADRGRAFRRARIHSVLVRVLRIAFPLGAVAAFGLYFLPSGIEVEVGKGEVSVERVDVSTENLRMINPKYEGFTSDNGRYVVRAASAMQDLKKGDQVRLESITARLTEADGRTADLTGKSGLYFSKQDRLRLAGGIDIVTSDGMRARLQVAEVSLKQKRIVSDQPVKVESPQGTVRSKKMQLFSDERRVLFIGDVVAHLVPPPGKGEAGQDVEGAAAPATKAAAGKVAAGGGLASIGQSDAPIDVTADRLEVKDEDKKALFTGSVRAVQGEATMTSQTMEVAYEGAAAGIGTGTGEAEKAEDEGAGTRVSRIEARDDVVIVTTDGRRATAAWSIFDRAGDQITLGGEVVLTDAGNTLTGQRLEVDLKKRLTRFPPGGRVRGRFDPAAAETAKAGGKGRKAKKAKKALAADPLAQGFTGFSADSDAATDIEADSLDVHDDKGIAIFRGSVLAVRGDQQIRASEMEIRFAGGGKSGGPGSDVSRLDARGKVVVTAPGDRISTSDWLIYDAVGDTVTIGGNVVVTEGDNVIKGDKLVVDLATGQSHFEAGPGVTASGVTGSQTGGRIRMLITQEDRERAAARAKGGKAPRGDATEKSKEAATSSWSSQTSPLPDLLEGAAGQ